jgi:hypothetical protein
LRFQFRPLKDYSAVVHTDRLEQAFFVTVDSKPPFRGIMVTARHYQELAVSPQTKRARIMFEENSGLTYVVRPERVSELVRQAATVYSMVKP